MDWNKAFQATRQTYQGKTFAEWFREFCSQKPEGDFLQAMTEWVVRHYKNRRKGGVPVGQLDKFCVKGKINLIHRLAWHLKSVMEKRGLKEADVQTSHPLFEKLDTAFRKAQKK